MEWAAQKRVSGALFVKKAVVIIPLFLKRFPQSSTLTYFCVLGTQTPRGRMLHLWHSEFHKRVPIKFANDPIDLTSHGAGHDESMKFPVVMNTLRDVLPDWLVWPVEHPFDFDEFGPVQCSLLDCRTGSDCDGGRTGHPQGRPRIVTRPARRLCTTKGRASSWFPPHCGDKSTSLHSMTPFGQSALEPSQSHLCDNEHQSSMAPRKREMSPAIWSPFDGMIGADATLMGVTSPDSGAGSDMPTVDMMLWP